MTEETDIAVAEEEKEQGEEGIRDGKLSQCLNENEPSSGWAVASVCRKEKRKASKKEKRKQMRKEAAEKERLEEEARLNDPQEQLRIQLEEEREKEKIERERREFEENERLFLEALAIKRAQEEEEQRRAKIEEEEQEQNLKENQVGREIGANDEDEWEYVEEGPPEIIWQGNEIIVKKNKVRVKKIVSDEQIRKEDPNRPTSNPLPPQSEAFSDFKNSSMVSAEQLLENVAQQTPNFGTEQDKAHCPFHLKTGACRFGSRCSRVHFYPDKSCTLLIKNMYNGPGLAWEQDEGLEYTEEEVEHSYEEFYEDVHTEFLKFGEIVNFKVCRNGSYHLRGNVYVHYKSFESAVLAYGSTNGRYFAGKQVNCEFIGVTRWKVAICGEYMRSKLKTCSRGTACNFIHCFRNPGGDYEWADWDKPAPNYWVKRMAALFGYSDESGYDKWIEEESPRQQRNSSKRLKADAEGYRSRRSLSTEIKYSSRSPRDHYKEDDFQKTKYRERHVNADTKRPEVLDERQYEEKRHTGSHHYGKKRHYDTEFYTDWLDGEKDADKYHDNARKSSRCRHNKRLESHDCQEIHRSRIRDTALDADPSDRGTERHTYRKHPEKISRQAKMLSGTADDSDYHKERSNSTDSSRDLSYENRDSVSSEDNLYRRRTSDGDSIGDCSDGVIGSRHVQKRKSDQESGRDKYHRRGSEHTKSNLHRSQKQTSSGERDHSSRKTRKVDYPEGHDEDIDTRGRWEPEKVDTVEHRKHRRKSHGESGSHDKIVNKYSRESGSRKRRESRSSNRKQKTKMIGEAL